MSKVEFKRFNATNTPSRAPRNTEPTLAVNSNNTIALNTKACELVGVKAGDKIEFLQHPTEADSWAITKSNEGFELRDTKGGLKLYNASVGMAIKNSFGLSPNYLMSFTLKKEDKIFHMFKTKASIGFKKSAD
jgi:hypothetical protein